MEDPRPTWESNEGPLWTPPVLLSLVATVPALLLTIEGVSRLSFWALALPFFLCAIASLFWVCFFGVALWTSRLQLSGHQFRRWLIVPVILVLTAIVAVSDIPFHVRFSLGRAAMDHAAAEVIAGGSTDRLSIGLFPANGVERLDNGMQSWIDGSGVFDEIGLMYLPDGPIDTDTEAGYERVEGDWWLLRTFD